MCFFMVRIIYIHHTWVKFGLQVQTARSCSRLDLNKVGSRYFICLQEKCLMRHYKILHSWPCHMKFTCLMLVSYISYEMAIIVRYCLSCNLFFFASECRKLTVSIINGKNYLITNAIITFQDIIM